MISSLQAEMSRTQLFNKDESHSRGPQPHDGTASYGLLLMRGSGALVFHVDLVSSSQKTHKVRTEMPSHGVQSNNTRQEMAVPLHDLKER